MASNSAPYQSWPPRELQPVQPPATPAATPQSSGETALADANAVAINTIAVGESILQSLGGQRETLLRSRQTLDDAQNELQGSSGVITTMMRRATTKKLALIAIVCALLGAILLLLFFKLSGQSA